MNLAFVFPGQGSQAVGMMGGFAAHPVVRETFAEASDVLGEDLWALVEQGPTEALNLTTNTQPVMLAAGIATLRAWQAAGGRCPPFSPDTASANTRRSSPPAHCLRDALPWCVFARGDAEAVPAGRAMAAIMGPTTAPWCPHARKRRRDKWSKR
jgi:[acyl-carrier-protein] S-malonyltransferase